MSYSGECQENVSNEEESPKTANISYRRLIGSLMYISISTRSDISFVVNKLSQYLESLSTVHWNAVKRVLRYLRGSTFGLKFESSSSPTAENVLTAYSDSDYAACVDSRRSTSGAILMINGGPITWLSRKQGIVATSTTEAEYVDAHEAAKKITWTRGLLDSLHIGLALPTKLYIDNAAAEHLIKNPTSHRRTKHIDKISLYS